MGILGGIRGIRGSQMLGWRRSKRSLASMEGLVEGSEGLQVAITARRKGMGL